jgi:hypothetical protein
MHPRRDKREAHELNPFERDLARVGSTRLFKIPMTGVIHLRRVANIGAGLMARLDHLTRRQDLSTRSIMLDAHSLITRANLDVKWLSKKGSRRVDV